MRSFMNAMQDYKRGVDTDNPTLRERISDAVHTLDLSGYSALLRQEKGREAAIFLKEIIDRVILIDYQKIPSLAEKPDLFRWRLRHTSITIVRMETGERKGVIFRYSKTPKGRFL